MDLLLEVNFRKDQALVVLADLSLTVGCVLVLEVDEFGVAWLWTVLVRGVDVIVGWIVVGVVDVAHEFRTQTGGNIMSNDVRILQSTLLTASKTSSLCLSPTFLSMQ